MSHGSYSIGGELRFITEVEEKAACVREVVLCV